MAYGKRTGARPMTVDGVTFHCYHEGILRYVWRSEDGQCEAGSTVNRSTYWAACGVHRLEKRFRSLKNAMAAAVKEKKFRDKYV